MPGAVKLPCLGPLQRGMGQCSKPAEEGLSSADCLWPTKQGNGSPLDIGTLTFAVGRNTHVGSPCWCSSFVTISVIYLRSTCSIQDNKRYSLKLLSGGIRYTEHRQESWQVPTASLFRDQPFPMKERGRWTVRCHYGCRRMVSHHDGCDG